MADNRSAFAAAASPERRVSGYRPKEDAEGDQPNMVWLITFTDIMGLMLTFFVMMFAMSSPKSEQFSEIATALQGEFNKFYGDALGVGHEDSIDVARMNFGTALDIKYLSALIGDMRSKNDVLNRHMKSQPYDDHLLLFMPQDILFPDRAQAQIDPEKQSALYFLAGTFSRMKNKVEITGHAVPSDVTQDQSTWSISLSRAVAVAASLDKAGYTDPVTVRGAADGNYQRYDKIGDENRRLDLSRRLDIDIMDHDRQRSLLSSTPSGL